MLVFSPRLWGCFSLVEKRAALAKVFPTPVGVFLTKENSRL